METPGLTMECNPTYSYNNLYNMEGKLYQRMTGNVNWLALSTCPNLFYAVKDMSKRVKEPESLI